MSFPDAEVCIGLAQEEHFPVLLGPGIGKEYQNALFLVDATQVKEVPVLLKGEGAVGTDGIGVVGVEDGQGFRLHALGEFAPVLDEELAIDRRVSHGLNFFAKVLNSQA